MSISHPLKMEFFRFANSGAALVDEMGGMIFGSLPGILIIYLLHRQGAEAGGGIALILLLPCALYLASLARFGERLDQKRERIADALS
jgi:NhaP-type Na+/H+ or K+/H+ antiporter